MPHYVPRFIQLPPTRGPMIGLTPDMIGGPTTRSHLIPTIYDFPTARGLGDDSEVCYLDPNSNVIVCLGALADVAEAQAEIEDFERDVGRDRAPLRKRRARRIHGRGFVR